MKDNGVTVAFYDPEKKKKRMKAYQEYINKIAQRKQKKRAIDNADPVSGAK